MENSGNHHRIAQRLLLGVLFMDPRADGGCTVFLSGIATADWSLERTCGADVVFRKSGFQERGVIIAAWKQPN